MTWRAAESGRAGSLVVTWRAAESGRAGSLVVTWRAAESGWAGSLVVTWRAAESGRVEPCRAAAPVGGHRRGGGDGRTALA
ncbi:MAG: hypothetical protein OXC06_05050 [Acidimicrobiaceae bacterium]|nr:hypothetical protein [Acidimicrobiaceae bacterium]